MAQSLYITSIESESLKTLVSLGLMHIFSTRTDRVGFFRPIINVEKKEQIDNNINLIKSTFNLEINYEEMYAYTFEEAKELLTSNRQETFYEEILKKYKALEKKCDLILVEGMDYTHDTNIFDSDINIHISYQLGCPVIIIANALNKSTDTIVSSVQLAIDAYKENGCEVFGAVSNRTNPDTVKETADEFQKRFDGKNNLLFYVIPEWREISNPTMNDIVELLNADVLWGKNRLTNKVYDYVIASAQLPKLFNFITKEGFLVITPGDRIDMLLGCILSLLSTSIPSVAGIVLTIGEVPDDGVNRLLNGLPNMPLPILSVKENTFDTALEVSKISPNICVNDQSKIAASIGLFSQFVDKDEILSAVEIAKSSRMTPKMFELSLIEKATLNVQHIVLPEGNDERILKAAEILVRRGVVEISILGNKDQILSNISSLGLELMEGEIGIIEPAKHPNLEKYVECYYELRKHKGATRGGTLQSAHETMLDETYFGTMMVHMGDADGMVSGAVHTTQDTIRPAFQIIKAKPGLSIVSSVFFMCLADRVLVYGDCAVNPRPNSEQLAEIAMASGKTAAAFDIEPRVALLSYSTGESGQGEEVERVKDAAKIVKERCPNMKVQGPIQYDAAVDPEVAKSKAPNSDVAGKATVFIFPDLNTGNNTYKAVQRSTGAVAIGPILQGLKKPVNDLSRGCKVTDIINTVIITAIQAQAEKGFI